MILNGQTKSEALLPDYTKGMFVIHDSETLKNELSVSAMSDMASQSEVIESFDKIRSQIKAEMKRRKLTIGDFDEFIDIATGEASVSISRTPENKLGVCLLVEVGGNEKAANDLIDRIGRELVAKKAIRKKPFQVQEATVFPYTVEKGVGVKKDININYAVAGKWLIATNDKTVAKFVIEKISGAGDMLKPIASVRSYQQSMQRIVTSRKGAKPHLSWYCDPLALGATLNLNAKFTGKKEVLPILEKREHGLVGVTGAAGDITLNVGENEMVAKSFLHFPNMETRKGAAKGLDFVNNGKVEMAPEPWIPAGAASYSAMCIDIQKAFQNSYAIIDDFAGAPNVIKKTFEGIRKRDDLKKDGKALDLENELVRQLGNKVTVISDPDLEAKGNSERLLITVEISGDPKMVASALDRVWGVEANSEKQVYNGTNIWIISKDSGGGDLDVQDPDGLPEGLTDILNDDDDEDEPVEKKPILNRPLVESQIYFVNKKRIMICNSLEYAKRIIDAKADGPSELAKTKSFVKVSKSLDGLVSGADSIRQFGRSSILYRPGYEMLQSGKRPESNSILGSIVNSFLKSAKEERRPRPLFNGKDLPADYQKVIAPYIGDYGVAVKTESNGWFITGIVVPNK